MAGARCRSGGRRRVRIVDDGGDACGGPWVCGTAGVRMRTRIAGACTVPVATQRRVGASPEGTNSCKCGVAGIQWLV